MTFLQGAKVYLLTLAVFLAIDFLWLGLVAKPFYRRHLAHFFAEEVNWAAAFLFYALFVFGLMILVIFPALKADQTLRALSLGVLYGLVTYATFDLTNLALLKDWPVAVVVVDILWGMVLSGIVATSGYWIAKWLS